MPRIGRGLCASTSSSATLSSSSGRSIGGRCRPPADSHCREPHRMAKRPTSNIVFWDLGGVILRTQNPERRRAWEARLGLADGDLARMVFDGPTSVEAMLGRASAEDVWASVGSRLGLNPVDRDRLRDDFFAADRIDEELMSFVRGLRPRARVGLISNAWPEIRRLLETTWGIADAFDPLVLSAEGGLVQT